MLLRIKPTTQHLAMYLSAILIISIPACQKTPPGMILIPSGYFLMGTDEVDSDLEAMDVGFPTPWYEDENPLHKVHLPTFYIDQYEVTNAKYHKFVKATNRHPPQDWMNGGHPPEKADFPVAFVNWYEADAYCRWIDKRLPTEAEWEKAARGTNGQKYPWGDVFNPRFANVSSGAVMFAQSRAVGQYQSGKSPYGVYDMIGTVWEWTDSWYQPYPGNTSINEKFGMMLRVSRGLSFMSVGHFSGNDYLKVASIVARASFRSFDFPTSRLADVGFRCAKSAG